MNPVSLGTSTGSLAGKVIAVWPVFAPFSDVRTIQDWDVKVSMVTDHGRVFFRATCAVLPQAIEHTDIAQLRILVEAELSLQHEVLNGATWEPWLEVQVTTTRQSREATSVCPAQRDSGLSISVRPLLRGTRPGDPNVYKKGRGSHVSPFPAPKRAGELDPEDVGSEYMTGRSQDAEFSYVPATPENIASLANLQDRLEQLGQQLSSFLSQEVVQGALGRVSEGSGLIKLGMDGEA